MSEYPPTSDPNQPQPPAYPTQPTQPYQPQPTQPYPPQPPQPPYAQPPAYPPAAPPKKKSRAWIWILVVVLLGGCLLTVLAGVGLGVFGYNSGKAKQSIDAGIAHYNKAVTILEALPGAVRSPSASSSTYGTDLKKAMDKAQTQVTAAAAELDQAQAAFNAVRDSESKTAYLEAIGFAKRGLEQMKGLLTSVGKLASGAQKLNDGAKKSSAAQSAENAAVSAANANNWSSAATNANNAVALYKQAEALFLAAHAADPSMGADKAAAWVAKNREAAELEVTMVADGKAGRISAYNTGIEKKRALQAVIGTMQEPAIVSDPNWADTRFKDALTKGEELMGQADEAAKRANAAYQSGKY